MLKASTSWSLVGAVAVLTALSACTDQNSEKAAESLRLTDVASYWSVKGTDAENNNYIRPVIRFRIVNDFEETVDYAQAMAVFRRESFPEEYWGSDYLYEIAPGEIEPGGTSEILTLRCDANFVSKDAPELMFENEKWEQVFVEVFVRVGPSAWKSVSKTEVAKRLGAPVWRSSCIPKIPSSFPSRTSRIRNCRVPSPRPRPSRNQAIRSSTLRSSSRLHRASTRSGTFS